MTPLLLALTLATPTMPTPAAQATPASPAPAAQATPAIVERTAPPELDGDLGDWVGIAPFALPLRNGDPEAADPPPLARLAYDDENLYLALEVPDDTLVFPERSWRYGDGFYLTVLMPGAGEASGSHVSFGFSRTGGRLVRAGVNRSGEYFPRLDMSGVRLAMRPGPDALPAAEAEPVPFGDVVVYEVAVPWALLAPADPLLVDSLAVNVVVVDSDGDRSRRFSMLHPDPAHDTERTPVRRGRMLPLRRLAGGDAAAPARPAAGLTSRVSRDVAAGGAVSERLAVGLARPVADVEGGVEVTVGYRPAPAAVGSTADDPLPLRLELRQGGLAVATLDTALPDLGSGSGTGEAGVRRTVARLTPAPGARVGTGLAMVRARVGDGAPMDRAVFLVDPAELDRLEVELERKETTAGSPAVRDAVATVAIRLAWLRDFLGAAPANAPLDGPVEWWTDAARWTASVRLGEAPVPTTPGVHRLAHRSRLDGTLQPYSIHLPDDYDPGHPGGYPLLVALHGSGVDERGTVASAGKATAARGWIVVAPRGRGLSDYYVGAAETDVLEALEHAIRILPVDTARVALGGFSMGGYGAWRMALRHGHRFDAVAVMAGAPCPPEATGGKCVDSLLDDAAADGRRVPPLLVVHGALDHAIPVDRARPLVRRARELTALEYREIPDAGHGHPSWWGEALEWLGPE